MSDFLAPLIKIYKVIYLFAYDIAGSYGISLILLSLFTFIVLYPFNKKAQQIQNKEHKIQAILSPQIKTIKKNYSGREQYELLQWLYRRYGYHPLYAIRSALGLIFQLPFLTTAYYMLSELAVIQGVSWGFIPNLAMPDHVLNGINILPFVMTLVTCVYAFLMPEISKKERLQTVVIGLFFLLLLYNAPSALLIFWTCNLVWSLLDSLLSKKLEWLEIIISENDLAFHIIFALALTVGIFVPTEIYIKNTSQLWFDYKDIFKYFLKDTVKYVVILLVIYAVCWRKKVRIIYLSVLAGLLFGIFLQSYIISIDYGLFDGHEIEWDKYTKAGFVNTFIWLFCIIETFINFKRLAFNPKKIIKYLKPIAFGSILIQCIVLLITLKNNPIQKDILYEDGKAGVLTTKDIYTVSEKDNIIIFLIDAFDASTFEEIQQKGHEVITQLKDFTYYPDTTSSFGFTIYSLPEILTGRFFDPSISNYPDFLNTSWHNNSYYETLRKNDYIIDLYTSGDFIDKKASVDNLIAEKVALNDEMICRFYGLVRFRIVPHYFKKLFYHYDPNLQNSALLDKNSKIYVFDDRQFYDNLKKGLNVSIKDNCLKFYHLEGMHYPWTLDENLEPIKEGVKGTASKAALGRLKIVNEYISQLKNHKLYDNATIAILADHGYNHMLGRRPLFMIKQPNVHNDYLQTSNRPSMVADLMPFVCKRFDHNVNKSDDEINAYKRDRFFYYEEKEGGFSKYRIKNNAQEQTSWVALGKIEQFRGGDRKYHIGDVIDFSSFGNSNRYKGKGWSINPTIGYSDIAQFEADVVLDIVGDLNDSEYIFKMKVRPILSAFNLPYKTITLYANNRKVGYWKFEKDEFEEVKCTIPKAVLSDHSLNLRFVVDVPEKYKNDGDVKANVKFIVEKMQIADY